MKIKLFAKYTLASIAALYGIFSYASSAHANPQVTGGGGSIPTYCWSGGGTITQSSSCPKIEAKCTGSAGDPTSTNLQVDVTCNIPIPLPVPVVNWPNTELDVKDKIVDSYIIGLADKDATKLAVSESVSEMVLREIANLSTDCSPYKRTPEGTCMITVGNWLNLPDIARGNVKEQTAGLLEQSSFFNFLEAGDLVTQLGLRKEVQPGYVNPLDQNIMNITSGVRIQPNTTLAGALTYMFNPLMNKFGQQQYLSSYLSQQENNAVTALNNEALAGNGMLSVEEVSQVSVDPVSGQETPIAWRVSYPGGILKDTISNAIDLPNKAWASSDNIDLAMSEVIPQKCTDDPNSAFCGGLPTLRTVFNMNKDIAIGMFETGPSIPNPEIKAEAPTCQLTPSPAQITVQRADTGLKTITMTAALQNGAKLAEVVITTGNNDGNIIIPDKTSIKFSESDQNAQGSSKTFTVSFRGTGTAGNPILYATGYMKQTDAGGERRTCDALARVDVTIPFACTVAVQTSAQNGFTFSPKTEYNETISWNNVGMPVSNTSLGETFNWARAIVVNITGDLGRTVKITSSNESSVSSGETTSSAQTPFNLTAHYPATSTTAITVGVYGDDPQKPLCTATQNIQVGYRCYAFRCPPAACYPPSCADASPGTSSPLHTCETRNGSLVGVTEYCDYYTGVRTPDSNNAYCVDEMPDVFKGTCY